MPLCDHTLATIHTSFSLNSTAVLAWCANIHARLQRKDWFAVQDYLLNRCLPVLMNRKGSTPNARGESGWKQSIIQHGSDGLIACLICVSQVFDGIEYTHHHCEPRLIDADDRICHLTGNRLDRLGEIQWCELRSRQHRIAV